MIYSTLVVLFASLVSPAANAFTSSPILYGLDTHKSSVLSLSAGKGEDLGMRFEKFPLTKKGEKQNVSLGGISFPLDAKEAKRLKKYTEADAVTTFEDLTFLSPMFSPTRSELGKYLEEFEPLYPGQTGFWEQFQKVVDAQVERREQNNSGARLNDDSDNNLYKWPNLWLDRSTSKLNVWNDNSNRNLNLDDVAQSVKGEFSNYHQQDAVTQAIDKMVNGEKKRDEFLDLGQFRDGIIPERDFIDFQVRAAVINAWSLGVVARTNFYLKWYYGVPRPEEVAWKIHNKELNATHGVPDEVITHITDLCLEKQEDFTAYNKGCPHHPSFPAMHSAGSTCSIWFPALYNIKAEDYNQLLRMDYGVAFARTIAGVHYEQDNLAGLNIGQRIVREKLPEFLAENYGYDAEKVRERLDDLQFDWNKYDNKEETINGKKAADFLKMANEKLESRAKAFRVRDEKLKKRGQKFRDANKKSAL